MCYSGYPYPYPVYGYQGNNDGYNSGWIWGILIILFILFFFFWGGNTGRGNSGFCN